MSKTMVCSCCGAPLNEENTCNYCGVRYNEDGTKHKISAIEEFEALMEVVNKRRPYEPSDFVEETFIPNLGTTQSKKGWSPTFFTKNKKKRLERAEKFFICQIALKQPLTPSGSPDPSGQISPLIGGAVLPQSGIVGVVARRRQT